VIYTHTKACVAFGFCYHPATRTGQSSAIWIHVAGIPLCGFILLTGVFLFVTLSSQSWAGLPEGTQAYDRGDYATATNELRPLAEGLASAQFYLGVMYENGQGVPQDYQEAARWYLRAAEQGHDRAQNNLGKLYEEGLGVEHDNIRAVQWYQKAAEQGLSAAQFNLAEMYMSGRGIKPDDDQAREWYRKAAMQGHEKALAALGQVPEPPTPVEIPKTVEPQRTVEPPNTVERVEPPAIVEAPKKAEAPNKAESPTKVPKKTTPKPERSNFARTVDKCTKEVQRTERFYAFIDGTNVRFTGTPDANFKFKTCMSRNGHPLVADK